MKDIKKMALELYEEAKAQGVEIHSMQFRQSNIICFGKPISINVLIDGELCDKQEKAPE